MTKPINANDILAELSPARRAKVLARGRQLIAEEVALRQLRRAHDLTQQRMAELLHMNQASISKLESRSDMLLSTLRSYVEAMGGSLRLVLEFPDGVTELSSLGETLDTAAPKKEQAKQRRPQLVRAE
jgi:transcriptional regulator with XRE-family HTH domain